MSSGQLQLFDIRKHYSCRVSELVHQCRVRMSRQDGCGHISRIASLFSFGWTDFYAHRAVECAPNDLLGGMVFGMEWNGARRLFDRRRAWLPTNPQRFSRREANPSIHLLIISLLESDIQDQEFMMPERVGHHLSYQGVCSDPMARTGCANKLAVQQLIGHDYAY
jgi:hypothetical protein